MKILISAMALSFLAAAPVRAGHAFLCTDSNGGKVALVSEDGKVQWEHACEHPQDCWILANGNFLFCHKGGALEMTRNDKVVWEYKVSPGSEVHACQPLPDGRVLVVECGASRLVEIDRAGKVAKEIKLPVPPASVSLHDQYRGVRKTRDGHYIICRKGEHRIEELDGNGKVLRAIPVSGDVHEAVLLPNKHLLADLGDGHKIIEMDADGKIIWEIDENDLPGNPLRLVAGCQRLPNGDTVFCNYLGHGHLGQQPQIVEVNSDKKVVWTFADHVHFKAINQVQLVDVPGDPAQGEILR